MTTNIKHLILGGARSGKSSYAQKTTEQLAKTHNKQLIYIATATAGDDEMAARILQHQAKRDNHWTTIEETIHLADMLNAYNDHKYCLLVDCLTLWLSNCLHHNCWRQEREQLLDAVQNCKANLFMVSNEVGSGVVPMGKLSRQFVDESGWLHQQLAKHCDQVNLIVAGLPLTLKNETS